MIELATRRLRVMGRQNDIAQPHDRNVFSGDLLWSSARRFAEKSHVAGIATKFRDVLVNPFQRRDLIHQTVIAGCVMGGFRSQLRVR